MNPVNNILPKADNSKCDINCKLKVYGNMVGLVYKNAKMSQELPGEFTYIKIVGIISLIIFVSVLSRLTETLSFTPKKALPESNINNNPPKILTTCQGGYGVEKERRRVCGM